MEPGRFSDKILRRSATDAEPEVVCSDDAFAYDPIPRGQGSDIATHFNHLGGPFMPGDQRIFKRNDVTALQEVDV